MKLFFSSNFFSNFYRWQGGKDDLESSFAWEEDGVTTLRSAVDCNKQKHTVLDCKKHKHTVLDCKKHNTITWCHSNTMTPTQSTAQQDPVSTMQKTGWIKSIKNLLNLLGKAMTNYKLLLRVIKSTGGGTADHALEVFFSCFRFFQFRFPPARWLCLRSEYFSFLIFKSSMPISQQGKMHVIWAFGQQQEFYGPDQLKYHGRSNRWEQSYFPRQSIFPSPFKIIHQ